MFNRATIEEFLAIQKYQKEQMNSLWTNGFYDYDKKRPTIKPATDEIINKLKNSDYIHQYKNFFLCKTEDREIGIYHDDVDDKFEVFTCDCVLHCCGQYIGKLKFDSIKQKVKEWYDE